MGFLGKILPWKRKDDLGLGPGMGDLGLGGFGGGGEGAAMGPGGLPYGSMPYDQPVGGFGGAAPQRQGMEAFQQNQAYERSYAAGKELEVVSAKLDAVKSALEALNQRLANIERYLQTEQDFKKRGGW